MTETLCIHIINFRTPDLTVDCLNTLARERESYPNFKVYLVDNASGDDSVERLTTSINENNWGQWIDFLPLEKNLGFAGGNNYSIRRCLEAPEPAPYQLLLNSDTLVHPGCLKTCMDWMQAHLKTGAFSCMLRNKDGSVQNVCRKFPRPDRETARALGLPYVLPKAFAWADLEDTGWDREKAENRLVEWVGGAFMLLRTEAIQQTGLMDESFFFYGEDCEWCYRLRKKGWEVRFDPAASITHLGGASSDSTRMLDKRREILIWKARFRVQRTCYGALAEWWVRGMYIYAFAMRVAWLAISGQRGSLKYQSIRSGLSTLTHPLDSDRV
jgi:N-acetylglucosaminyl-diphospho-decaprenol L-rhamnosyltransferase